MGEKPHAVNLTVPESDLADLKERLARTRWPDQLEGTTWEYGTDSTYLKDLVHYWQHDFDWKKQEAKLNSFASFMMDVNGINLHFVHERSQHADAIPLLLLHGWPGSFWEFHRLIPMLTRPARREDGTSEQAFHVVAPSLPGYGFSSAPKGPGFGIRQMAATMNEAMLRLGYERYVAQGGDWGGIITFTLGALYSEHAVAIHSNMAICSPSLTNPWHLLQVANGSLPFAKNWPLALSAKELEGLKRFEVFRSQESGYMELQRTKPQTIGYALNDSPAGLAAYIAEKFWRWSDVTDAALESKHGRDWLLTNVSIYWHTRSITSSMRLYKECAGSGEFAELLKLRVKAHAAVANFPKELACYPRNWVEKQYNLKQWSTFDRGGHFAALEEPELLAGDMRKHFSAHFAPA